ncbi:MAG: HDIG domain-containing protein [Clostridiales bacterium]|jgi:putative nucleotidyltransferase with HDIG domain|nr:HDIG domain-containing protein [Clostridiales bacterium]
MKKTNEITKLNTTQKNGLALTNIEHGKIVAIFLATLCLMYSLTVAKFFVFNIKYDYIILLVLFVGLCVMLSSLFIFLVNRRKDKVSRVKILMAICFCMFLAYSTNIYLINLNTYSMSMAFAAFLIAPLTDKKDAFVSNIILILMVTFVNLVITIYIGNYEIIYAILGMSLGGIICGTLVSYTISKNTFRLNYVLKGLFYGILSFLVTFVFMMLSAQDAKLLGMLKADWFIFVTVISVTVFISQTIHPITELVFNILTDARLVELTNHSSPLIHRLMTEAPGTFNHSMAVANFAEVCANAIGENPYMARTAAYYHDVGKLINPTYFKENQEDDYNPHDELLPEISAEIIRKHTTDGFELCKKYRIPIEIAEITIQHHGSKLIYVFYNKAQNMTDQEVDKKLYSYNGETPRTKIAALIMICDAAEATIRSMAKPDGARVDKLLKDLIESTILTGQLDNCAITLKDLDVVRQTIKNIYGGIFHGRISYSDAKHKYNIKQ